MSWQRTTLGEVATIVMGQSPPGSTYNEVGQGLPFYQGVKDFGSRYPTKHVYCTAPTRIAEEGDILFSVRAPIGSINRANEKCSIGRGLSIVRAHNGDDFDFIEYLLKSMNRAWGAYESQGAIFGNARRRDLEDLQIAWPPHSVRVQIASILSAYDDLIENNRRRIRLLEESARLLYREWFVRLRFPGHEHVKIIDGVPEGWEKSIVSKLGDVVTGKTPSTKEPDNFGGKIPFIKTPDMHKNPIIVETSQYLSEKGANSQAKKYIPKDSIMVSCIGTVGIVAINAIKAQTNQQINTVIPQKEHFRYYIYFALSDLKSRLEAMGGGATMVNVNKGKFESLPVVIPSDLILQEFHEVCNPMFLQIKNLLIQNQKLKTARDLLLPRLMNGETEV